MNRVQIMAATASAMILSVPFVGATAAESPAPPAPAAQAPADETPEERRQRLIADYRARFANPYTAAERGYVDDVIVPHETRPKLITALETLTSGRVPPTINCDDPEDLRQLLDMLGLIAGHPDQPPPVGR